MRAFLLSTFFLTLNYTVYCQIPDIIGNYKKQDSSELQQIDSFVSKYEYILSYTQIGGFCRSCPAVTRKILAFDGNEWTAWEFTNYRTRKVFESSKGKYLYDTIKTGTFFKANLNLSNKIVKVLLDRLTVYKLWNLENDSLNRIEKKEWKIDIGDSLDTSPDISDNYIYRFDIIKGKQSRVIERYAPKHSPAAKNRNVFFRNRFVFLKWWVHCRIEQRNI